jgi:flagellar hook assembly protein FlgD
MTARVLVVGAGGREIRSWVLASLDPGEKTIQWDGRDERGIAASPGTYFVKVTVGDHIETQKLVLVP